MDDKVKKIARITIGIFLVMIMNACSKPPSSPKLNQNAPYVSALRIKVVSSFSTEKQFIGSTLSTNSSNLGFELSGKIIEIRADVGDIILQGSPIASLDTALILSAEERISATIKKVEAQLNFALRTLTRSLNMSKKQFVSAQKVDEQQTQVLQLEAQISELNAERETNRIQLEKSTLIAPFDGQVVARFQSLGNTISAGESVIQFNQNQTIQAQIHVPSNNVHLFRIKQNYPITVQGQTYTAQLLGISKALNKNTQTHQLRFYFPQSELITPNAVAVLKTSETQTIKGSWIPNESMLDGIKGLWNVYILKTEDEQLYRVRKRNIEVIFTNQTHSFVSGAISNGELLLIQGAHKVVPNQIVNLAKIESAL